MLAEREEAKDRLLDLPASGCLCCGRSFLIEGWLTPLFFTCPDCMKILGDLKNESYDRYVRRVNAVRRRLEGGDA